MNAKPIPVNYDGPASADHPPGFYGPPDAFVAVNTLSASDTLDAADLINNSILTALKPSDFEMLDGGTRVDATAQDCKHVPITQ